ncbi:glycosyltransferase domain-containing protein [Maribacter sp. X9]|uniref:glycosyltransferase domain-containing protein n=1 Tax=Maribacter sp. X9 TaxID=3402159 RepID=UPI003AF3C946
MRKKVIYTCLAGNYDILEEPQYIMEDWEYICFSNDLSQTENSVWEIRKIPFHDNDKRRLSRYAKLLPHKVLADFDTSIYIDSNIIILSGILENRVKELEQNDVLVAIAQHPERNCIYEEAKACVDRGLESNDIVQKQMKFYKTQGFPENFGLYENNIIYRQHNNSKIVELDKAWWNLYITYSQRDQLSLAFLLWKLDLKCSSLFEDGFNIRKSEDFKYKSHDLTLKSRIKRKINVLKSRISNTFTYNK